MSGKETQFIKLQIPDNVSRNKKNDYADVYHICAQSDFLQGLPSPPFYHPSASIKCFQGTKRRCKNNLNKSEITAFGIGMVCFFLHSLKCTV